MKRTEDAHDDDNYGYWLPLYAVVVSLYYVRKARESILGICAANKCSLWVTTTSDLHYAHYCTLLDARR
jgi:hypothetical protein